MGATKTLGAIICEQGQEGQGLAETVRVARRGSTLLMVDETAKLMAHSPKHYTEMGRLVADAGKRDWDELTAEYEAMLMEGLSVMGTRGNTSTCSSTWWAISRATCRAKTSKSFWPSSGITGRGWCR